MTNMAAWACKNHKKEIDTWSHRISCMILNSIPTYAIITITIIKKLISGKIEGS